MKVITEKSKNDIGKRLSAIYYIALHGFGEDIGSNYESAAKIIEHIHNIAYAIGGEHFANIELPAYVMRLKEYEEKKKMNDLISRQAAIDEFYKCPNIHWTTLDVLAKIKELPTAEKKGKWINHRNDEGHNIADCDQCGEAIQWFDDDLKPNYCPNCGARMEE